MFKITGLFFLKLFTLKTKKKKKDEGNHMVLQIQIEDQNIIQHN